MQMHCPSCGQESALDQKFCRQCGFNLEPVGKLVAGEPAVTPAEPDHQEMEGQLVRQMFQRISWGVIVLLIGIVLLVITRGIPKSPFLHFLASFLTLGGFVIGIWAVFSGIIRATYLPGKSTKSPAQQLNHDRDTKELPEGSMPVPVPSVTERTTQLIGKDAK